MAKIHTLDSVRVYFKERGCQLLSTEYVNCSTKMEYFCSCGNKSFIDYHQFRKGKRCKKCAKQREQETQRKKYNGKLYMQTEQFKKKRKETNIKRYGVEHVAQNKQVIDKMIATNLSKYGIKYIVNTEECKEKVKQAFRDKYGVESLGQLRTFISKESQNLFWEIYNKLPQDVQLKCHFGELNSEFCKCKDQKYYKYDFVNTKTKKAIEYNGKTFHPKPYQDDSEIGWFPFDKTLTVKQARAKEKIKYSLLENEGYEILTIWDFEYKSNKQDIINKCIAFILSGTPSTLDNQP